VSHFLSSCGSCVGTALIDQALTVHKGAKKILSVELKDLRPQEISDGLNSTLTSS
jgi:hypothetical protein